jgi:erythromycin esterase
VTELDFHQEHTDLRIDQSGRLSSMLPPGHYAFAVTAPNAFAYVEQKLEAPGRPTIALSPDCHRVHGRVAGAKALPATVVLSRFDDDNGYSFRAAVNDAAEFAACLPQAMYSVIVEGEMASMFESVHVPSDTAIEIAASPVAQIQQVPRDVHIANSDLASFARGLRDRRVVGLGEANHGTGDFYRYREQLSLELARTGGLRSILFEADAIGMMAIDDYVMGRDIDLTKALPGLRSWITDIQECAAFLTDVRAYNGNEPPAGKIRVLGFDAQRLEPPVQWLQARRAELAILDHESELLSQVIPGRGVAFTKMSSADRTALSSLLDRLAAPRGVPDLEGIETRASIAARSLRYQLRYLEHPDERRDHTMAELATYIIEQSGAPQTALWAHDGHLGRQTDGGEQSMGQFLAEKLEAAYYPIAFLSYQGYGRAWDRAGQVGVIPHELWPAPPYNLESVIMNATGFIDAAWVRLDTATGTFAQWLQLPRFVREFGSAYEPSDTQHLRSFPGSFAAAVVIQRGHASTPTPTGVRMLIH